MHYLISDTRGRLLPLNTDVVLSDRWLAKVSIKINALLNLLFRPRIVSINGEHIILCLYGGIIYQQVKLYLTIATPIPFRDAC
jgi:hypothetical protein